MKELILGGARSGKSSLAEELAQSSGKQLVYLATAQAGDGEMSSRIALHQQRRNTDKNNKWQLIEEPTQLAETLQSICTADSCILVDCLTLWLSNLLHAGSETFEHEKAALLELMPNLPGQVIFVSNETGLGVVPLGELTRQFVDEAGWLHQAMAAQCDRVVFVVAGLPQVLKGPALS